MNQLNNDLHLTDEELQLCTLPRWFRRVDNTNEQLDLFILHIHALVELVERSHGTLTNAYVANALFQTIQSHSGMALVQKYSRFATSVYDTCKELMMDEALTRAPFYDERAFHAVKQHAQKNKEWVRIDV